MMNSEERHASLLSRRSVLINGAIATAGLATSDRRERRKRQAERSLGRQPTLASLYRFTRVFRRTGSIFGMQ